LWSWDCLWSSACPTRALIAPKCIIVNGRGSLQVPWACGWYTVLLLARLVSRCPVDSSTHSLDVLLPGFVVEVLDAPFCIARDQQVDQMTLQIGSERITGAIPGTASRSSSLANFILPGCRNHAHVFAQLTHRAMRVVTRKIHLRPQAYAMRG
jgi:hypothetical protein